jgi:hypothetical protein
VRQDADDDAVCYVVTSCYMVGDSAQCPSACQAQKPGPDDNSYTNYDGGADGMLSVIVHEMSEMVTGTY